MSSGHRVQMRATTGSLLCISRYEVFVAYAKLILQYSDLIGYAFNIADLIKLIDLLETYQTHSIWDIGRIAKQRGNLGSIHLRIVLTLGTLTIKMFRLNLGLIYLIICILRYLSLIVVFAIIVFFILLTALFLLDTLVLLQTALAKGMLIMALVLIFQILNHLLKLIYLGRQLYYKLFVAFVAGRHRIQGLLQGVYHIHKTPI